MRSEEKERYKPSGIATHLNKLNEKASLFGRRVRGPEVSDVSIFTVRFRFHAKKI